MPITIGAEWNKSQIFYSLDYRYNKVICDICILSN